MEKNSESNHLGRTGTSGPALAALLVGGLLGAGAMMLLAPRSGRETRSRIQHKALELREQTVGTVRSAVGQVSSHTQDLASKVKDRAGVLDQQSREVLAKQLDNVAEAAKAGKDAIRR
jgi:gas vesicle protein